MENSTHFLPQIFRNLESDTRRRGKSIQEMLPTKFGIIINGCKYSTRSELFVRTIGFPLYNTRDFVVDQEQNKFFGFENIFRMYFIFLNVSIHWVFF